MGKPFIHPQALCETSQVGARTRIWAFAHLLPQCRVGDDCNICDGVFIENDVEIGHRVTVKCGVQLWNGVRVADDVFIGPNVTFTNDNFPRSRQYLSKHPEIILEQGCSIGANATILPGLRIGRTAMVGAGAVVTRSVPPNAIVVGNPAQIVGYVTTEKQQALAGAEFSTGGRVPAVKETQIAGVTFHQFPLIQDLRGDLTAAEYPTTVPFVPQRHFMVFNVGSREVRGEHAHHHCAQFLICVAGTCHIVADDGVHRQEFILSKPTQGLYLPPLTWATQYKYSPDAVLLVLASEHYNAKDYIRDYDEFLALIKDRGGR